MIDYLSGSIKSINDKTATILVNGFGFLCHIPQIGKLQIDDKVNLFTHLHWNQEKGPSLYGFLDELERKVFLMIIDCSKIGPSLAIKILSQLSAPHFLEIITSQDEKALSSVNGIGTKKAEQLIMQLRHKVEKLINSGIVGDVDHQQSFVQWQNISDVLTSLNYSKKEISSTLNYLTKNNKKQNQSLDQLIRASLAFLSKNQMSL